MVEVEFISYSLTWYGRKDTNEFYLTLSGNIDKVYRTNETHFVGSIYEESFSDAFFLPDTVWNNLKELKVSGTVKGRVKYRYWGETGSHYKDFSLPCVVTLSKGAAVTKDDVAGHWIKISYDFDLTDFIKSLGNLRDYEYSLVGSLEISATFPTIYYWSQDFDQSISTSGVISSAWSDPQQVTHTRYRAIAYSKETGQKTTGPWRNTLAEAETDLNNIQTELADTHFGFAIETEDNPEPGYKPPPEEPTEKHNRIYGKVTGPLGEPIQFATITFGGKTATTDQYGNYEILDVWYSGEISCSAPGYKSTSQFIEAPSEGDLEVNFNLQQELKEPPVDISPVADNLKSVDQSILQSSLAQIQAQKTQGDLDKTYLATALRQVGLDDWADKYNELYDWLTENFGVPFKDPVTGEEKKIIILVGGFQSKLPDFAKGAGISATTAAIRKAQGAIAGALGGLTAGTVVSGVMGVVGTVIFTEFICEEAVQTAGMGVYQAMQTKDIEVIRQAIENYRNIVNATKIIHDTVRNLDPIGFSFDAFFQAAEDNLSNYEKVLTYMEEKQNYGKLKVMSKPTHAKIAIDDEDTGLLTSEVLKLPVGFYKVSVWKEGYHEKVFENVEVKADQTTEVYAELERMKIGTITIRSRPSQAAIYINGQDTHLLTPQKFELEEGTYEITLKYLGYQDRTFVVKIKEGQDVEKYIRLVRAT